MANLMQSLNEEIRRLARKEMKRAINPLRQQLAALRKSVAAIKDELKAEAAKKRVKQSPVMAATADGENQKVRINAKGIAALRTKLGISQTKFGALIGVGSLCVSSWEAGRTHPRQAQLQKLAALRKMGKREVARLLAAMDEAAGGDKPAPAPKAKAKKAAKKAKGKAAKAPAAKKAKAKPAKAAKKAAKAAAKGKANKKASKAPKAAKPAKAPKAPKAPANDKAPASPAADGGKAPETAAQ